MSLVEKILTDFDGAEIGDSLGQTTVRLPRESLVEVATRLRDGGFAMFIDLCAVDHLARKPRFEVVVNLLSMEPPERVRLLVGVPGDEASLPSITGVFPGANFYERETYDLFGLVFEGHPDLTRILLPDDWSGHPLRKDTPVGAVPVQFKFPSEAAVTIRSRGGEDST